MLTLPTRTHPHEQDYCGDEAGIIDYQKLYYCHDSHVARVFILLLICSLLLYLISLLASTADNFFVVQLQQLSSPAIFNLSRDVAGVTLLALGNGAPDIFTAVTGVGEDDLQLALSDLMGGGIFVNSIVLGCCLLVTPSGERCVDRRPFLREWSMYLLTVVGIAVVCYDGVVTAWEGFAFVFFYLVYISIVLYFRDVKHPEPERPPRSSAARLSGRISLLGGRPSELVKGDNDMKKNGGLSAPLLDKELSAASPSEEMEDEPLLSLTDYPSYKEDGPLAVAIWYLEYPVSILRHLSIPSSDDSWCRKRRILSALSPIFGLQLTILAVKGTAGFSSSVSFLGGMNLSVVALVVAAVLSLMMFVTSNDKAKPRYFPVSVFFAFAMSVVWLDLVANEVVAILEFLGILMQASTSILGLTVLAWGNSVGDLVADTAMAKAGCFKSSVASVFASPLLSALVGLGIAFTVTTLKDGNITSTLNAQNTVAFGTLSFTLCSTCFVFVTSNYQPPRKYAYFLFAVYFAFLCASIIMEAVDS